MLRLASALVTLLLLSAMPAAAQDVTPQDRAQVSALLTGVHDRVVGGDMSAAMDVLPPGVIDAMANRYGVTPEEARQAARDVAAQIMADVEILDYRVDVDGAQVKRTPDGSRTYLMVPLHMTMRTQGIMVKTTSSTLVFQVDGAWYGMSVDGDEQADVLREVYPEFAGVEFPAGTMEIVEN